MIAIATNLDTVDLAAHYERIGGVLAKGGAKLLDALRLQPGNHVLDVGCGTGLVTERAADLVGPRGSVVGIDPLDFRIDIAKRRGRPNLHFAVGDACDLGHWPAATFDAAYLHLVFHWLPDKREALNQLRRVMKPGARLGITTAAKERENTFHAALTAVLSRAAYSSYPKEHSAPVTAPEIADLLSDAGFESETIDIRPSIGCWKSADGPDGAIAFFETISFGNLLGHLPPDLQCTARAELARELSARKPSSAVVVEGAGIFAVATRR